MKKSDYVTLKDASKILNVSSETLRNWDRQGKLKAVRHPMNKYRLYDLAEIQEMAATTQVAEKEAEYLTLFDDGSSLKNAVRNMSKAFRDSQGGSLLERFEEISKLLFCKLYDEQHNHGLAFGSFSRLFELDKIYESLVSLFAQAKKAHPNVFVNGRAALCDDKKAIAQVALILQRYQLSNIRTDIKGKVYEELVKNTFDKSENQQFFTPRHLVNFLIELLDPQPDQSICDPACGSGGFLIAALEHLQRQHPHLDLTSYCRRHMLGAEIDSRMVWIAQMNLIMHGGHHDAIRYLPGGGSLSRTPEVQTALPEASFDLIITNPPFGSDFDQKRDLEQFELGHGKKSRRRGILFLEKCLRLLKPGGRLAIVLEESILNNGSGEDVRRLLLRQGVVENIISLPDTTFMPYATVKTSVLIVRKKRSADETQPGILMCNIEQVGFGPNGDPLYSNERDAKGKLMLLSDLPEAFTVWKEFQSKGRLMHPTERYFVSNASIRELEQRLDTLFHHPAKESAQQLLAKAKYPLHRIGEVVTMLNQMVVPQYDYPDEMVRYIGLANIRPHEGSYFVSEVLGEKLKSAVKRFEPESVIFAKLRPELRKVVFIPSDEEAGFASSECFIFKATPRILPTYLALMLRSDLIYGQIIFQVTGLGRPRIGRTELLSAKIPLPPLDKQRELVKALEASESNKLALLEKSTLLREQANELMRRGFADIEQELCR